MRWNMSWKYVFLKHIYNQTEKPEKEVPNAMEYVLEVCLSKAYLQSNRETRERGAQCDGICPGSMSF